MRYITLNDMMQTVRRNIWKIPHDIDFVIGVPRSGMICGSVVSEFINVPLIDLNSFVQGVEPSGGMRLSLVKSNSGNIKPKVLVMDDTVFNGTSMRGAKTLLTPFNDKYDFIYCVAYLEGSAIDEVNIYLEDVRCNTDVIYEWNIFNHHPHIMKRCMYDLDGVFCVDPPDERNEEEYLKYIKNAIPLFIPKVPIGKICTYRLIKNQEITQNWLKEQGIVYDSLFMFNAKTYEERQNSGISPSVMKAKVYGNDKDCILFIESDDYQAREIHQISGKQVLCVSTNKLYG
jgi:uncharacterized HAD superfamily protein